MADSIDPRLLDKRTAARHIRSGILDEKAYERYLKALPDLTDQAVTVVADLDRDEEDDEPETPENA